jgi:hypothetical protein
MRRLVKANGGQVPCEPCKDANARTGCCREANKDTCDNFELFEPIEDDDDDAMDVESPSSGLSSPPADI